MSFEKLHKERKEFLMKHENEDHVVVVGEKDVLISVPHAVSQVRLGKYKVAEIGSLVLGRKLSQDGNTFLICKTKNNNDDANFDENSEYKNTIRRIINKHQIKYIVDIHGMAAFRGCDVNLGTHLGKNTENNKKLLKKLCNMLEKEGFSVCLDQPFMAGSQTIAGSMKNEYPHLWTIQIEINCAITNKKENFFRFEKLTEIIKCWIEMIK